jgi:PAS domain S-box-containing protein
MVMIDRTGRVVLINTEAEVLFGYSRREVLGHSVELLIPTRLRGNHPSFRQDFFKEPQARRMGAGLELFGLRKDGSEFPVEIGLKPIAAEGQLFVLSAIVNITQRRLLESRFRATVESAPTAMVMINRASQIVLVNAETEALFGYSRTELIGAPIETLVPERFRHSHPQMREHFRQRPVARRMGAGRDLFAVRKNGSEFPVEIGLNPVETEEGLFILSAIVDITERRRGARQLEAALREKTVLLNEIHHRVKNNLQIISGLLQLQSGQTEIPGLRELLNQSQSRVQSMAVIHELLYESGDFTSIRLDHYFARLAGLLWTSFVDQNDQVQFIPKIEPVTIDLNRAIPCGLLANELLTNCLKHARASRVTLTLRLNASTNTVFASVADDGIGLPPNLNLDAPRSLGLTLATQLAEQIGAELGIQPTPQGTCFQWEFPLIQESSE